MVSERLDIRLDAERRRRLEEMAAKEQASISETLRRMIDRAYEAESQRRRAEAAEKLVSLELDNVPEPDELNKILDDLHDAGDLY